MLGTHQGDRDTRNMGTTGMPGAKGCWEHEVNMGAGITGMLAVWQPDGYWEHGNTGSMRSRWILRALAIWEHWEHEDYRNTGTKGCQEHEKQVDTGSTVLLGTWRHRDTESTGMPRTWGARGCQEHKGWKHGDASYMEDTGIAGT